MIIVSVALEYSEKEIRFMSFYILILEGDFDEH